MEDYKRQMLDHAWGLEKLYGQGRLPGDWALGGQGLAPQVGAGAQAMSQSAIRAMMGGMQQQPAVQGVTHPALLSPPDKYHTRCPECSREFINNISCPRCGWVMSMQLRKAYKEIGK